VKPDPAHDTRPVYMRIAQPATRTRSPVIVQLVVDGSAKEQSYKPKGFKSDGESVGEWRVVLSPGQHRITVSIATRSDPQKPRQTWSAEVLAQPGRLSVLSLNANQGFEFAP
jgi:hypothetical protein